MYEYLISILPLVWLLIYVKDDPKTIQGKFKIFFVDVAQYLKLRIINIMKNKVFFLYFFYCLIIHIIYIYYLSNNKFVENENEKYNNKKDIIYFILFYIMIVCATLIESDEKEEYEKKLYFDNIPFFLSNLIWLFYMIIKTIIKFFIIFKEQQFQKIDDIKNDFYNFAISTKYLLSNIFFSPFYIVFDSYNMLSDYSSENNLPIPSILNNIYYPLSYLASFSFNSIKSGFSKIYTNLKGIYNVATINNKERLQLLLNFLFENDKYNFIFLIINSFNFIFVIFIIIFIIVYKLIKNFLVFREKMNQKIKYKKYVY